MIGTPIKIMLYTSDGEVKQEYSCSLIPWGILKKAISLTQDIDQTKIGAQDLDAIAQLVVDVFGKQFSLADLDAGADIGEMMSVLQSVVSRASGLVNANPTPPIPSLKKK
jgi:hypothetical protein